MKHSRENIYRPSKRCRRGGGKCLHKRLRFFFFFSLLLSFTNLSAQIISKVVSGSWSSPGTWVGDKVPGPGDNVVIANGASIIINDNSAVCQTITIEGALHFNPGVSLEVNGDWINNGTVNAGTGTVFFKGAASSIIGGSSATAFNNLVVNKGTDITSVLEVVGPGAVSNYGTLTISSGLLKMTTGSFQFTSNPNIPVGAGFWVNGATVSCVSGGLGFSIDNSGLIRVSAGVLNVGTASGNELHTTLNGTLQVDGGTVNVTGRLVTTGGTTTITGGLVNVSTIGHTGSLPQGYGSFHMSLSTKLTISGNALIVIHKPNGGSAGDISILNSTGTKSITGGAFQLGSPSSPPGSTFVINSAVPLYDLSVFNNSVKASLANDLTISNQLTLNGQLWLNDKNLILGASATAINGSLGGTGGMLVTNGNGEVRKTLAASGSYSFPVGTVSGSGTAEYSPLTITYAGTVGVKVSNTRHAGVTNNTDFLKRFWSINSVGVTSAGFDVTASYLAADVVGDETNIAAGKYGSTWTKHGVVNASLKSISITGLTDKSTLTISGITLCTPPEKPTSGGNQTACALSPVQTLTATTTAPSGSSIVWYDAATGGNVVSSPILNAVGTVTYYAASRDNTDGCESVERTSVTLTINARPAAPTGNDQAVCATSPVQTLTATVTVPAGFSVVWYDANSGGNVVASPTLNSVGTITYYAVLKDDVTGCESASRTPVKLTIQAVPNSFSVTGGGSYCTGGAGLPVGLSGSQTGVSYQLQKDGVNVGSAVAGTGSAISFGNQTAAGTYTVVATNTTTSCTEPMTGGVTISINPLPTASAGSNSPVCASSTLNLTSSGGVSYSWTGPNGFSSTQQNPSRSAVTAADGGTYTVTVTDANGCSAQAPTTVTINPSQPVSVTIVSSDADNIICAGDAITFTATPTNGGTTPAYQWRVNGLNVPGANASTFTSSTLANGAVVQVVLTSNATPCATDNPAPSNNISVTVNPIPSAPTAGNGGAVCVGGTINLTASSIAGASYSWTGPNGFTSTSQNPTITGATAAMAGTYSVTATVNGCTSPAATTTVTVNTIPATPGASSNSPVCAGTSINLSTPAVAGATYSWTGPNGFTSSAQNPTIASATTAMAGAYNVTITVNGCTSAAGSTNVVVNTAPAAPTATNGGAVCVGGTISLQASTIAGATYAWTGPNGFTSALQNPAISGATAAMAGTYSVTATVAGCTSVAGTTNVVVNPIPSAPTAGSNSPVCVGSTINLTASTIANATYSWSGPNGFTSTSQNPSIANATAATAGNYTVTVTVNGCTSPASAAATVVVNPIPSAPTAGNGGAVCVGGTISLTASTIAGATYSWTGPTGFTSIAQNPTIANATTAMAGTYNVTVTVNGCTSPAATTTVTVNTIPTITATTPASRCNTGTVTLGATASAGTINWYANATGGSSLGTGISFTTPSISSTTTYYVDATANGCTTATRTAVVATVTNTPSVTGTTAGGFCGTGTATLGATASAGTLNWYSAATGGALLGTGTSFTTPSNGATTTYYVEATLNGCTSGRTAVIATRYTSAPTSSSGNPSNRVTISGPSSICPPTSTGVTYTAPSLSQTNSQSYVWSAPSGFVIASGQGTSSITVNVPGGGASSGNIQLIASNPCGSVTVNFPVTLASFNGINVGSNISMCVGTNPTLTNTLSGGATRVTWVASTGTISGGPYPTPFVYTPPAGFTGTATLTAYTDTAAGSCSASSSFGTGTVIITVNDPPAITTQPVGQTLCSGNAASFSVAATGTGLTYQWKKNGSNISGATSSSYTIPSVSAGKRRKLYSHCKRSKPLYAGHFFHCSFCS